MRFGEQHQESRRHTCEPEGPQSRAPEDIGTPFSTWLPLAPADDQVHLGSQIGEGMLNYKKSFEKSVLICFDRPP
jgi:hypothetical protein